MPATGVLGSVVQWKHQHQEQGSPVALQRKALVQGEGAAEMTGVEVLCFQLVDVCDPYTSNFSSVRAPSALRPPGEIVHTRDCGYCCLSMSFSSVSDSDTLLSSQLVLHVAGLCVSPGGCTHPRGRLMDASRAHAQHYTALPVSPHRPRAGSPRLLG